LLYFNNLHPDGHYDLNLGNLPDRGVAQRCMVISNWVRHRSIALKSIDLSEYGNYECLRHTRFHKGKFMFDSVMWQLPDDGYFVFDLVLPRFPLEGASALKAHEVKDLCDAIETSPCNFKHKLSALRLIAHRITLRPESFVTVMKLFPQCLETYGTNLQFANLEFRPRVEAYIIFYNRTLYHARVVSPQILFNPALLMPFESAEIRARQGYLHTFDLVNLGQEISNLGLRHGPLDMTKYDGWILVKLMMQISWGEPGVNFFDCLWTPKAHFYERGYAFCIPRDWNPDPPHFGEFTGTWHSKPEEVLMIQRREMAARYLAWTFPPSSFSFPEVSDMTVKATHAAQAALKKEQSRMSLAPQ